MMFQLHAQPNVSKFPDDWIPLIDDVAEGFIFYWAMMLYDNIDSHIL